MARRQRFLLQVLDEIFMDPLSEDDVDHLRFKKITVTASSKKHLKITWAQGDNTGTVAWGEMC